MTGLVATFGSGAMTNSVADLGEADVILVIGSNTTEAHPIIGIELKRAALAGTRLIVVDPRRIPLVDHASDWLRIRPGANVALFNAMAKVIVDEGLVAEEFVASRTEGYDDLVAHLATVDIDAAAERTGIDAETIREVARAYATAGAGSLVYCMGVTQHTSGTAQVRALANLALLTGHIGRPGTGVNPLRGQSNVQGACDLACLPNCLPGYQPLTDRGTLDRVCDFWETEIELPAEAGLTVVEMMDAAAAGELKALYVMGENPVLSDPDQAHVIEALENLDFLVVQDIFLTETAQLADVVLPAATFLEKDGTYTNTDRRVQLGRRVVEPPLGARPDLEILTDVANALGLGWDADSPREVMVEMGAVTPQYGGITYRRLEAEGALRWPCPDAEHPGTPILYTDSFPRGRAAFAVSTDEPPAETPDAEFPLVMGTGRHLWNFHTNTMTGRSAGLAELNAEGYVEISAEDAGLLGVCEGERVRVTSRQGSCEALVRVAPGLAPGVVFMPFHFAEAPANRLTSARPLDPGSKIPGLKTTPVRIERLEA